MQQIVLAYEGCIDRIKALNGVKDGGAKTGTSDPSSIATMLRGLGGKT